MKAITAVCATGASVPAIANGRVSRPHINRSHPATTSMRDSNENAEMQLYLSKLKDLVPYMPRNRKISKLEVILNVIDYICDLQTALESHPAVNTFDAQTVLNGLHQQQQHHQLQQNTINNNNNINRQPLGVRNSQQNNSISNSEHLSEYSTNNHTTSDKISTANHLTDRL